MNLHGITTAHGDVGLGFSFKVSEFAADTGAALGMARHLDGLHAAGPDVARKQAAMKSLGAAGEKLQGFGSFEGGDQIDDWPEDTDGVAGLFETLGGGAGFEKTGEARSGAGTNGHGQPVTGDGGGVDPRESGVHREVVDQEARLEIVGAIEEQMDSREEGFGVARAEIGDDAFDGNGGIDRPQFAFGGDGLGKGTESVGFVEERLPLQVRRLHEIPIDDSEIADAGTNEKICGGSADGAAANNGCARGKQPLLAFRADAGEEHLARVFIPERIVHERPRQAWGSAC